jgi:hypothetical protein
VHRAAGKLKTVIARPRAEQAEARPRLDLDATDLSDIDAGAGLLIGFEPMSDGKLPPVGDRP